MKYRAGIVWGGGIMLVVSILGSLLGPSPIVFVLAPFMSVAFGTGMLIPGLSGLLEGGLLGGGSIVAFVVWSTILGIIVGVIIEAIVKAIRR